MPTRLIREGILTSEAVTALTWPQAVFYHRLLCIGDDYGLYDARPAILRAKLYPLQLHIVSDRDIQGYHAKCVELGLVKAYIVDGRPYGRILKYGQQPKAAPKFPPPEDEDPALYKPAPKKKRASVTERNETTRPVTARNLCVCECVSECEGVGVNSDAPPDVSGVRRVIDALAIDGMTGDTITECAVRFMDAMRASGWRTPSGQPLKDWKAAAANWARRYAEREGLDRRNNKPRRKDCNHADDYD